MTGVCKANLDWFFISKSRTTYISFYHCFSFSSKNIGWGNVIMHHRISFSTYGVQWCTIWSQKKVVHKISDSWLTCVLWSLISHFTFGNVGLSKASCGLQLGCSSGVLCTTLCNTQSVIAHTRLIKMLLKWKDAQIARFMGPTWGPLGPAGPRWAPCWSHEPCYQGECSNTYDMIYVK